MSDVFPLNRHSTADLDRATEQVAPHWRPVLAGVRDAGLGFASVMQNAEPFVIPRLVPTMLLLGDDMDVSKGPTAFHARSVRKFVKRCYGAVIVAGAPEVGLYAAAAAGAALHRRDVVIVETTTRHEADWMERLRAIKPGIPIMVGTVWPESRTRH